MSEKKVMFVTGSEVKEGERTKRFVASCDCGNTLLVAKKESSLNFYINKWTAKNCCGSKYHLIGEREFIGSQMVKEAKEKKEEKEKMLRKPAYDKKSPEETLNTIVANQGKVSFTVFFDAIKANADDPEAIRKMYLTNKEAFVHTISKYIVEPVKVKAIQAIRVIEPEFTLNVGKRFVSKVDAKELPEAI